MLVVSNLTKAFGPEPVLSHISLQVKANQRLGLIGRNGCGKSTLLKLMMGDQEPDSGTITRPSQWRINCLRQEPHITPGRTLTEEVRSVFAAEQALLAEEAQLVLQLPTLSTEAQLKAAHRLDELHQALNHMDVATLDARISRMLTGLGFTLAQFDRPVETFSGGWQMRINLAKVLLGGADLLLLDEPTNHLDLEACEWLEDFLTTYPASLVVVSHDRRFLDRLCTDIAEIENGRLTLWPGNYSDFVTQKAAFLEREASAIDRQQKELSKQTAFVERFRASATKSTQAKSREKQLAKITPLQATQLNTRRMNVTFPTPTPSGKQVVTLRQVAKAFDTPLFSQVSADLQRYQRVFLLGPNGCGKTTLLRIILGQEAADEGDIKLGHHVHCGYFSQHQLETLDPSLTPFETIHNQCPNWTQTQVRNLLAGFLFTGEDVFKPVSVLSGGEKSRLAMAKLMLAAPNTLLLDEPTNHLDIPAKEVLEDAFRLYDGTMLCISHDRYFIQQLATDIWELYDGHLIHYMGGYDDYLASRDEKRARLLASAAPKLMPASAAPTPPPPSPEVGLDNKTRRALEKELKALEKTIMALETDLAQLHEALNQASLNQHLEELQSLSAQLSDKQALLDTLMNQWEALTDQLTT